MNKNPFVRLIAGRLAGMALTLFAVLSFTFLLTFAVPNDPARAVLGPRATPEQIDSVRQRLGLDQPMHVQYGRYLARVAQGDLGFSYSQRRPVMDVLVERLPYTALLALGAITFQVVVGVALGLWSAARAGQGLDKLGLTASLLVIALPPFWVGLVLLYVFAYLWPIFPLGGASLPWGLVLPSISLGLAGAAWTSRVMRLEAYRFLQSDVVRGLRAKGLQPASILTKHTLRGATGPVLTMLTIDLGYFMGGAVLIESVYNWPGIGLASFLALKQNDIPLLMGCVIIGSIFVLVLNLVADIARTKVDPRVQLS